MKSATVYFIIICTIVVVIACIACLLYANYYYGKQFHPCPSCPSNKIHIIDVPFPKEEYIECLFNALKTHGSRLNPELNFNNAKGKKLNGIELTKLCPSIVNWFMTDDLARTVSKHVGEAVAFADINEKYRIFARIYDDEGDFLNWHYDNNFTKGNRYTLVIPLVVDDCNTAEFEYKDRKNGKEVIARIPLGKGVLYNGSELYHRITKQTNGCRRIVIIIPFYADYRKSIIGKLREKLRNITYQQLTL
jgi:hypothetical protein